MDQIISTAVPAYLLISLTNGSDTDIDTTADRVSRMTPVDDVLHD